MRNFIKIKKKQDFNIKFKAILQNFTTFKLNKKQLLNYPFQPPLSCFYHKP